MRAWWEAGDTHYLLNTSLMAMGGCTHEGDAARVSGKRIERGDLNREDLNDV